MAIVRVSTAMGRALLADQSPAPQKYGAKSMTVDGFFFRSTGEATRYGWLKWRLKAGQITNLTLQTPFTLHVCNLATGELTAIGDYVCDFDYLEDGQRIVEDWKGMATLPLAKWKIKHLNAEYGIIVRETRKPLRQAARRGSRGGR